MKDKKFEINNVTGLFQPYIDEISQRVTEEAGIDNPILADIAIYRDEDYDSGYYIYVNGVIYADSLAHDKVRPFLDQLENYIYGYLDGLKKKDTYKLQGEE